MPDGKQTNIRDPVHGDMAFTSFEMEIIDSPEMQRLRKIRQLAIANLVYPGANHTRFEHSLGTCHVADAMARALSLGEDERMRLRIAALLHDVGHLAFSHESEIVLSGKLGSHEELGKKRILNGNLSDIISKQDSPKKVAKYLSGNSYGQLICSDIGADRIDYLLRDAHYTGVAYGVIDSDRIVSKLHWGGKAGLAVQYSGLEAVESLLLARFQMFSTVYFHHTVRIASAMLRNAIFECISDSTFPMKDFLNDGDMEFFLRMRGIPKANFWLGKLAGRNLYKVALRVRMHELPASAKNQVTSGKFQTLLESDFSQNVLVDLPPDYNKRPKATVFHEGEFLNLEEISPIVASLEDAMASRASLLVCADKAHIKTVSKKANSLLGLNA